MGKKRLVEMPLWYAIGRQYIGISNDEKYWQTLSSVFEQARALDLETRVIAGQLGQPPKP